MQKSPGSAGIPAGVGRALEPAGKDAGAPRRPVNSMMPSKIISGGQTGADRAALNFAIAHGIPHGGWCPKNRRAEDGPIPAKYSLNETPSTHYAQRTEWNVRHSNATLIFTIKPTLTGGTRLT